MKSSLPDIERLYEKCPAEELGFARHDFCGLVLDVMSRSLPDPCAAKERTQFLESLHLDELVLARACSRGNEKAWDRFVVLYREKLYGAARAIARDESLARELADSLYADLFGIRIREDGSRSSKLESYSGRGSLEGWLRTILAQNFVSRCRIERKLVSFDDSMAGGERVSLETEQDGSQLQLSRATDATLAELSAEERLLLAAYFLDGRTLAEIARILGVHESTVSRRLEKTTAAIRKRIVGRLRASGIGKRAAEEMLNSDVRDLEVEVRSRLAQGS